MACLRRLRRAAGHGLRLPLRLLRPPPGVLPVPGGGFVIAVVEQAEMAKLRARLHLDNANVYARHVAKEFGLLSPEYAIALHVVSHEQAALVAAYDRLLAVEPSGARS